MKQNNLHTSQVLFTLVLFTDWSVPSIPCWFVETDSDYSANINLDYVLGTFRILWQSAVVYCSRNDEKGFFSYKRKTETFIEDEMHN